MEQWLTNQIRNSVCVCVHAQSLSVSLCNPMNYSPQVSSIHGIFQARILEWVAISHSRGSSRPKERTHVSCIGRWVLYLCAAWEPTGKERTPLSSTSGATKGEEPGGKWGTVSEPHTAFYLFCHFFLLCHPGGAALRWKCP